MGQQSTGRQGKGHNSSVLGSSKSEISNDEVPSPLGGKRRQISNNITTASTPQAMEFPNGKDNLNFDEFIDIINESCSESNRAENYLVLAFSMFDREK